MGASSPMCDLLVVRCSNIFCALHSFTIHGAERHGGGGQSAVVEGSGTVFWLSSIGTSDSKGCGTEAISASHFCLNKGTCCLSLLLQAAAGSGWR